MHITGTTFSPVACHLDTSWRHRNEAKPFTMLAGAVVPKQVVCSETLEWLHGLFYHRKHVVVKMVRPYTLREVMATIYSCWLHLELPWYPTRSRSPVWMISFRHQQNMTWKRFPHYWSFVKDTHQSSADSPLQRNRNAEFSCFFDVSLNKLLSKQSIGM